MLVEKQTIFTVENTPPFTKVFCDGEEIQRVFYANTRRGYCKRYKEDSIEVERVFGVITVEFPKC